MSEHVWETETVDGGPLGAADFQVCRKCGANGGLANLFRPGVSPSVDCFFADGCGLELDGLSCEEAAARVREHCLACERGAATIRERGTKP